MTERNAIDGLNNTPHSSSLDNFRYHSNAASPTPGNASAVSNQSSVTSSPQKALTKTGNHMPSSNSYPNSFGVSAAAGRTASPASALSSPGTALSPGGGSVFSPAAASSANSSYNTPQSQHKYLSSSQTASGQNSLHSSMTSFQHTPARSTLPTDYKQPNGYSAGSSGASGWPPVRHTPSPAPSLPAQNVARSDSRASHSYESASLDRKDRKSTYDARAGDYSLRFTQTLGAAESRSMRRSKRGRAGTPTQAIPAGGVADTSRGENDE